MRKYVRPGMSIEEFMTEDILTTSSVQGGVTADVPDIESGGGDPDPIRGSKS